MVSFKTKIRVLHELFAKNHRGAFAPPSGARVNPRPAGEGQKAPCGFSQIAHEVLGFSF